MIRNIDIHIYNNSTYIFHDEDIVVCTNTHTQIHIHMIKHTHTHTYIYM